MSTTLSPAFLEEMKLLDNERYNKAIEDAIEIVMKYEVVMKSFGFVPTMHLEAIINDIKSLKK